MSCDSCPGPDRRAFLREAALAAAGVLLALGLSPSEAAALPLSLGRPATTAGDEHGYPVPAEDGATIDKDNQVILVRYQGSAYAFALSCPHQNTALHWLGDEGRFQCPKHKSKYRPDGSFISGRATRGMDRFAIRRDGSNLVVDLARLFKQDADPEGWKTAVVAL